MPPMIAPLPFRSRRRRRGGGTAHGGGLPGPGQLRRRGVGTGEHRGGAVAEGEVDGRARDRRRRWRSGPAPGASRRPPLRGRSGRARVAPGRRTGRRGGRGVPPRAGRVPPGRRRRPRAPDQSGQPSAPAGRLRDDQRHHDVDEEEEATGHEHQDDPDDPHQRRVDVVSLGDPAGHAGDHPLVAGAVEAIVHLQPPSGSSWIEPRFAVADRSILTDAGGSPARSRSIPSRTSPRSAKLFEPRTCARLDPQPDPGRDAELEAPGVDGDRAVQVRVGAG